MKTKRIISLLLVVMLAFSSVQAMCGFVANAIHYDYSVLAYMIENPTSYRADRYTEDSFAFYQAAFAAAEEVYNNPQARNTVISSRTRSSGGGGNGGRVLIDIDDEKEKERVKQAYREAYKPREATYKSLADSFKDPKIEAAQASRERARERLDELKSKREAERKSYNKATGNKYNTATAYFVHNKTFATKKTFT